METQRYFVFVELVLIHFDYLKKCLLKVNYFNQLQKNKMHKCSMLHKGLRELGKHLFKKKIKKKLIFN